MRYDIPREPNETERNNRPSGVFDRAAYNEKLASEIDIEHDLFGYRDYAQLGTITSELLRREEQACASQLTSDSI